MNVDAFPLFLLYQEHTTYGFSAGLQGRHYLEVGETWTPFISLGLGVLVTDKETPPGTANLNFTPQIGVGFTFHDKKGRVFTFEYRLHHISNASRADENPGINSSFVQFSVGFSRRNTERD